MTGLQARGVIPEELGKLTFLTNLYGFLRLFLYESIEFLFLRVPAPMGEIRPVPFLKPSTSIELYNMIILGSIFQKCF